MATPNSLKDALITVSILAHVMMINNNTKNNQKEQE